AGLLIAKLLAWWVALASGTAGGTLAPILLISASFGGLVGRGTANLFPGLGLSAGAFAVVAMAATFGSATRAPFTAIVFVFELTRDYNVVLPLMLASVMASLVAAAFLTDSIMTEKLTRRGVRAGGELHVDVLRTTVVGDDRLVGICTRAAIVRARADQIALDQRQSGWLRPIVSRRRPRRVLLVGNRSLGQPSIVEALRPRAVQGRLHVHVVVPTGPN